MPVGSEQLPIPGLTNVRTERTMVPYFSMEEINMELTREQALTLLQFLDIDMTVVFKQISLLPIQSRYCITMHICVFHSWEISGID